MATTDDVLNCEMEQPNDAQAATIRDYLKALLLAVWDEAEGFSGKRPFGNSGWMYDVYASLERAGLARTDDDSNADALVRDAIKALR